MNLKDFCNRKTEINLLRVAIIFLAFSILLSLYIYLNKVKASLNDDIKQIIIAREKIKKTYDSIELIEKLIFPEIKNKDLAIAQMIDSLNARFPELKVEKFSERQEGQELIIPFSIKGDGNIKRFSELISFLNQQSYPLFFINSVYLKAKENMISFEIKVDLRAIR